jgi:hypothetical protein
MTKRDEKDVTVTVTVCELLWSVQKCIRIQYIKAHLGSRYDTPVEKLCSKKSAIKLDST